MLQNPTKNFQATSYKVANLQRSTAVSKAVEANLEEKINNFVIKRWPRLAAAAKTTRDNNARRFLEGYKRNLLLLIQSDHLSPQNEKLKFDILKDL